MLVPWAEAYQASASLRTAHQHQFIIKLYSVSLKYGNGYTSRGKFTK